MPTKINPLPPLELVRSILNYDPDTGAFRWRMYRGGTASAGDLAGCIDKGDGYKQISIKNKAYAASRLAWLLHYGEDPHPFEIDHINQIKDDDRIANLRKVTSFQNGQNVKLGASGYRGVTKNGRFWYAQVSVSNIPIWGPPRESIMEAAQDRELMVVKYHLRK